MKHKKNFLLFAALKCRKSRKIVGNLFQCVSSSLSSWESHSIFSIIDDNVKSFNLTVSCHVVSPQNGRQRKKSHFPYLRDLTHEIWDVIKICDRHIIIKVTRLHTEKFFLSFRNLKKTFSCFVVSLLIIINAGKFNFPMKLAGDIHNTPHFLE